jgi:hypothetical protein
MRRCWQISRLIRAAAQVTDAQWIAQLRVRRIQGTHLSGEGFATSGWRRQEFFSEQEPPQSIRVATFSGLDYKNRATEMEFLR